MNKPLDAVELLIAIINGDEITFIGKLEEMGTDDIDDMQMLCKRICEIIRLWEGDNFRAEVLKRQ